MGFRHRAVGESKFPKVHFERPFVQKHDGRGAKVTSQMFTTNAEGVLIDDAAMDPKAATAVADVESVDKPFANALEALSLWQGNPTSDKSILWLRR